MQPSVKNVQVFLTVLFPVVLLLFSFFVFAFNQPFYNLLHDRYSPAGKETTEHVFDYLFKGNPLPEIFTLNEASHLADVKALLFAFFAFFLFLLILWIVLFVRFGSQKVIFKGSILTIIFLLAAMFFPFDFLFTWFHKVFFFQGNWQFSNDSTLIQAYPLEFFQVFFSVTVITAIIISIFLVVMSKISLFSSKT